MQNSRISSDDFDFYHSWQVLKEGRKIIAVIVGGVTVVAIVVSLLLPVRYVATAMIMPIGPSGGGAGLSALVGQLGGLGSLIGIGDGASGATQRLVALSKSRTLAEQVIINNNLIPVLFARDLVKPLPTDEAASGHLLERVKFVEKKKDMKSDSIEIVAEFEDPKLAAFVANAYVEGLQKFVNANTLTVSKRNRIFIGQQLEENKRALLMEGKELSDFYKGNKVSGSLPYMDVPVMGDVELNALASLNEDNDVGYESMLGEDHKAELKELQNRRNELESTWQYVSNARFGDKQGAAVMDGGRVVRNVPQQVYLQYLTLHRSLLIQINALLTQQYEMAKISEKKDELAFQVIDEARVPEHRSSPKRFKLVIMSFLISILLGVFVVFCVDFIKKNWKVQQN